MYSLAEIFSRFTDFIHSPKWRNGIHLEGTSIGSLTSHFAKTNNIAYFGYQSANVKVGEGSIFNVEVGKSMPSRPNSRIAIGSDLTQDTNIAIAVKNSTETYSGTNKIAIGSTGNTLLLGSSTITLNTSLTPNYSYYPYGTGSGKIGEIIYTNIPSLVVSVANSPINVTNFALPIGIWSLQAHITTGTVVSNYNVLCFSNVSATLQTPGSTSIYSNGSVGYELSCNLIVSVSVSTNYYLVVQFASAQTITNINYQAVRIA